MICDKICVSGMVRLGITPHVTDKILNHQAGTISGVAAVYQRHDDLHKSLIGNGAGGELKWRAEKSLSEN